MFKIGNYEDILNFKSKWMVRCLASQMGKETHNRVMGNKEFPNK